MIRLGVNIDHIATLRNARGGQEPDPVQAALFAELGGADNITCHLREDRRHITDRDLFLIKEIIKIPLNLEMAATDEMLEIAQKLKPHFVTLVPEKRQERTTEGGLELSSRVEYLKEITQKLQSSGILVSLFVEPQKSVVMYAKKIGARALEFHTGTFASEFAAASSTQDRLASIEGLKGAANEAHAEGLQVHVGHGLNYSNVHLIRDLPFIEEANIGHSIISRAVYVGLKDAVAQMHCCLNR